MYIDVSAEMMMKTAVGFDLSLSQRSLLLLLLLTGVYKGNVRHMLLVDNVNAKNMNNAGMQTFYAMKCQRPNKWIKKSFFNYIWADCDCCWSTGSIAIAAASLVKEGSGCGNTYTPMANLAAGMTARALSALSCFALQSSWVQGGKPRSYIRPPRCRSSFRWWRQRKTWTGQFTPMASLSFPSHHHESLHSKRPCIYLCVDYIYWSI